MQKTLFFEYTMTLKDGSTLLMNPYDFHPCFENCNEEHEHTIPQYQLIGLTLEEANEQVLEQELDYLRKLRNQKLLESDWTQLPNNHLTEDSRQEWFEYRQQLRNITIGREIGQDIIWPDLPKK
jgi:hypothetical protein